MKLIDGHAHIYEYLKGYGAKGEARAIGNGKVRWATGEVEQFFPPQYGDYGFKAEALLQLMEENDIEHAVLLQGGNYGFHNDYCAEQAKLHPDKFTAVGTIDPYAFYKDKILSHFVNDLGFKALKFEISQEWGMTGYHPELRLDNEYFAPILDVADELGMTIVIDMGFMGTGSFKIDPLKNISKRYRNITFVMTHCFFPHNDGNNDKRLGWMKELVSDKFVFDIANLPPLVLPEPYPYNTQLDFIKKAKTILGADHIIWGTDVPGVLRNFTYRQLADYLIESGIFNDNELKLIMHDNAIRVYKIGIVA